MSLEWDIHKGKMVKTGKLRASRRTAPRGSSPLDHVSEPHKSLYRAVDAYVSHYGGKLVVVGGVQLQEWPGDGEFRFTIGIRCTGRKPTFEKANSGGQP